VLDKILSGISAFIIGTISTLGYGGVVLMMAIESACIPLPSEVIMPFSGFLVASGRFNLQIVAIMGAIGCLLGSYLAYYVGAHGGRRFIERYGRYLLIAPHELEAADRFFERWGSLAVFLSRMLPVVRTFIAFPAGVARMPMGKFIAYTFIGSFPWCLGLGWVGVKVGEHRELLTPWFHKADAVIVALMVAGVAWFVWKQTSSRRRAGRAPGS